MCVWILGCGGQTEIRCVHGMVWHASVQDLDFCTAVYKSVLQAEFVKTILKLDKLPSNTVPEGIPEGTHKKFK